MTGVLPLAQAFERFLRLPAFQYQRTGFGFLLLEPGQLLLQLRSWRRAFNQ